MSSSFTQLSSYKVCFCISEPLWNNPSGSKLVQGIFYKAQLMPEVFQYVIDAFDVL